MTQKSSLGKWTICYIATVVTIEFIIVLCQIIFGWGK